METANETTFIRVGTVILNVRMIAYAWMEDDMMVIMLNALIMLPVLCCERRPSSRRRFR